MWRVRAVWDRHAREATTEPTGDATAGRGGGTRPFGGACSAVPAEGEGGVDGMADDPVATAASDHPEPSPLVQAVQAAGLVDTSPAPRTSPSAPPPTAPSPSSRRRT
ncbi:hypothetical protein WDH52_08035 [Streptomyces sp. TRM70308]|uniref:hypothetical protein n=1 Tax=Streptomyces sp. TRM70308 TaxID=3131932 RepID=UPI003D064DFC